MRPNLGMVRSQLLGTGRGFAPGIRYGTPQLDDEVIREAEGLQVGVVDGLGEVHRVGLLVAQVPDLGRQLRVVDAHEGLQQVVDGLDPGHCRLIELRLDLGIAIGLEAQRLLAAPVVLSPGRPRRPRLAARSDALEAAPHWLHVASLETKAPLVFDLDEIIPTLPK